MKKAILIIFVVILLCLGYGKLNKGSMSNSLTELNEAIRQNNKDKVKEILKENPNLDLNPPFVFGYINKPLFIAARSSDTEVLALLLQHGADIEGICSYEDTPLITALENHKYDNAKFLMEKGANVNKPNSFGISPFIGLCAGYGPFDLFVMAFEKGGELDKAYPITVCSDPERINGRCPVRYNSTCLELRDDPIPDANTEEERQWAQEVKETREKIKNYLSQKGIL